MKQMTSRPLGMLFFCLELILLSSEVAGSFSRSRPHRLLQVSGNPSSNLTNSSRNQGQDQPKQEEVNQNSSSDVPIGVWIGVGCGILGFFALLIYLLSKRQPQVGNATNPQSPVTMTEQVPIEESSGKSAQDETDPNPVQAYPALTLEAMLSFDEEALQNIGQNVVGMPMATRYYTYPGVRTTGAQSTEPGGTDQVQMRIIGDHQSPQLASMLSSSSPSPNLQPRVRLRKSRIKRSKNAVPTLVTLNLRASEPAEQPVLKVTSPVLTSQALGSTFRPEQGVEISPVRDSETAETGHIQYAGTEASKEVESLSSKLTITCSEGVISENDHLPEGFSYKPYKIPTAWQEGVDPESISTESKPSESDVAQLMNRQTLPSPRLLKRLQAPAEVSLAGGEGNNCLP